jgi:rubrerythrin
MTQNKDQPEDMIMSGVKFNRTGIGTSPLLAKEMIEGTLQFTATSTDDEELLDLESHYLETAEPIGTVPPPTTVKGIAKAAVDILKGEKPTVLLDKIAGRLAFERSGTRLYEALIRKFDVVGGYEGGPTRAQLVEIFEDEYSHFEMLSETLKELGADPTAMTPCADLVGVQSLGLLTIVTDPRTTFAQSLEAMLTAELVDVDGWEVLLRLTEHLGLDTLATRFDRAAKAEERHLASVREWFAAHALYLATSPAGVERSHTAEAASL